MNTIPFDKLPGDGDQRMVDGHYMDREEYEVCGFHVIREYRTDDGKRAFYWGATLDGLQRYGRLKANRRQERHSSWQARVDADDEYSDSITAMLDKGEMK